MECKNCSLPLEIYHNYCPDCGAKVIRKRLTLRALFSHFSEQFLNYDNKFLKTFLHLFSKPETVIGCYISGTRKKYVNVISYFAIALTITGLEWYLLDKFFPEAIDLSAAIVSGSEEQAAKSVSFMQEYASIMLMLFAPLYALMSRLVFLKNKTFNYTEHIVIFMYVIAQISILGSIFTITGALFGFPIGELAYINLLFQVIFSAYCLKRMYNLSLSQIILKTLLFLLILFIMMVLSVILYIASVYLFEGLEGLKNLSIQNQTA